MRWIEEANAYHGRLRYERDEVGGGRVEGLVRNPLLQTGILASLTIIRDAPSPS